MTYQRELYNVKEIDELCWTRVLHINIINLSALSVGDKDKKRNGRSEKKGEREVKKTWEKERRATREKLTDPPVGAIKNEIEMNHCVLISRDSLWAGSI